MYFTANMSVIVLVVVTYLVVRRLSGLDVLRLQVRPAHGELLRFTLRPRLMPAGDADLSASAAGGQGVDDVGTGAPSPVVGQADYVYFPVTAEIDVVEDEIEIASVVDHPGPVEDVPVSSFKIVHAEDAGLQLSRSSRPVGIPRAVATGVPALMRIGNCHSFNDFELGENQTKNQESKMSM